MASEAASIFDNDDANAVAFDAVEDSSETGSRLDGGRSLAHPNAAPGDPAAVEHLLEALTNKRRPSSLVIVEGHRQRPGGGQVSPVTGTAAASKATAI
jgi:hypothetical protein